MGMGGNGTAAFAGPPALADRRRRTALTAADEGRGLVQTGICEASHISVGRSLAAFTVTGS